MKKIGLITFHRPINFGAALQAVALSKAIEKEGAACEIIDYINPTFEKQYSPIPSFKKSSLKGLVWSIVTLPQKLHKIRGFRRFIEKNAKLSRKLDKKSLGSVASTYDSYVTGSDQVWNLNCSGNETAYFLDFVKDKPKNSYAASFGDFTVSEENRVLYQNLLSDFDKISVRETSGIKIVSDITGRACPAVLDPTLLLNNEEWGSLIAHKKPFIKKPYLLIYFMVAGKAVKKEMMALAHRVAKEKKLEIVIIGGSLHKKKNGIYYADATSPEDFVSLFRDASFVVTSSFHGTAFSVNFKKSFYSYVKPDLAIKGRVSSLLEKLGLESRLFSHAEDISEFSEVDYCNASQKLQSERAESIEFLRGVIHGE